jgi:hypothetical protein
MRLSGYDGVTGARILRRLVETPHPTRQAFVAGLRATAHRCSDIQSSARYGGHREVVDMLSGSGRRLWSLRYSVRKLRGNHLVHYKAPKRFCALR